jgi:hypothetical protein
VEQHGDLFAATNSLKRLALVRFSLRAVPASLAKLVGARADGCAASVCQGRGRGNGERCAQTTAHVNGGAVSCVSGTSAIQQAWWAGVREWVQGEQVVRLLHAATCSSSCKQRVAATMAPVAVALRAGCGDGVSSSVVSGSHDDGDGMRRRADGQMATMMALGR